MKMTPQILAAGVVSLFALLVSSGTILGGFASYSVSKTFDDFTVAVPQAMSVVPAHQALGSVVLEVDGQRARNPWNLRPVESNVSTILPLPPPPQTEAVVPPIWPNKGGVR